MKHEDFKTHFQKIVFANSEVISSKNRIKQLSQWDKNGSHEKAILNEINRRKDLKEKLNNLLNGKTYNDWRDASIQLTKLKSRLKKQHSQKQKLENEINILTLDF